MEHLLTPQETFVLRQAISDAQAKLNEVNALVRLLISQHELDPRDTWQPTQDGAALVNVSARNREPQASV